MKTFLKAIIFIIINFLPLMAQDFWQKTNGPYGGVTNFLAINSNDDIFRITSEDGLYYNQSGRVYRSSDNGKSWHMIDIPPVAHLLINTDNDLFTGIDGSLYRSTDNGENWEFLNPSNIEGSISIGQLLINSNNDLIAISDTGFYRSTDCKTG